MIEIFGIVISMRSKPANSGIQQAYKMVEVSCG